MHYQQQGFLFCFATPCSYLAPLIDCTIADRNLNYCAAVNEGDAVAMACGAILAGKKSLVIFQNNGLGNAINALTSPASCYQFPLLMVIGLRGDPTGAADEPQHHLMGQVTKSLLASLNIRYHYCPDNQRNLTALMQQLSGDINTFQGCHALLVRKGTFAATAKSPPQQLGRPTISPVQIKPRLSDFINNSEVASV